MRAVKGHSNLSTEMRFRGSLMRRSVRGWKVRPKGVYGNPDFVFRTQRIAVFVDGCFWHGCPSCARPSPKTNEAYWKEKMLRNKRRDLDVNEVLVSEGWTVMRYWEHEVRDNAKGCVFRLTASLARL